MKRADPVKPDDQPAAAAKKTASHKSGRTVNDSVRPLCAKIIDKDEFFMRQALKQAQKAAEKDEVPVGALIVKNGTIIARGYNTREKTHDPSGHAEINALRRAAKKLSGWNLHGCELYVTLEPCPMCAGAIINARVARVFYGARDSAFGACGGVTNLFMEQFPHRPALVGGILAEDCQAVLAEFFEKLRQGKPSTQSF